MDNDPFLESVERIIRLHRRYLELTGEFSRPPKVEGLARASV